MGCLTKFCSQINDKLNFIHSLGLVPEIKHGLAYRKGPIVHINYSANYRTTVDYVQTKKYLKLLQGGYMGTLPNIAEAPTHAHVLLTIYVKGSKIVHEVDGVNSAIERGSSYVTSHTNAYGYTITKI